MNIDQLITLLINAGISGVMLAVGMMIGSKLTSRSMIKEVDEWTQRSELFQTIKKLVTDQTLIEKATKFFEEATVLVSSPEAKNFFKNMTELMKTLGEPQKVKLKMPEKKRSKSS